MSEAWSHSCFNRELLDRLSRLKERNVLLLLLDGSAIFGCLVRVDNTVLTLRPPLALPETPFVSFRLASSPLTATWSASQLFIDSQEIAHVVEGPFLASPLSDPETAPLTAEVLPQQVTPPIPGRQYCKLAEELIELADHHVTIATLGGWAIGGCLKEANLYLARIETATVHLPPLIPFSSVSLFGSAFPYGHKQLAGTFAIWSNLKILTQVILP